MALLLAVLGLVPGGGTCALECWLAVQLVGRRSLCRWLRSFNKSGYEYLNHDHPDQAGQHNNLSFIWQDSSKLCGRWGCCVCGPAGDKTMDGVRAEHELHARSVLMTD